MNKSVKYLPILIAVMMSVPRAYADEYDDICFEPGIIYRANYIEIYPCDGRNHQDTITIQKSQPQFSRLREWIGSNFLKRLREPRLKMKHPADYCIRLAVREIGSLRDILAVIKVSKETLGPNYQEKLNELLKLANEGTAEKSSEQK